MYHDDRVASALVHVVELEAVAVEESTLEWIKLWVYHSTPSIRQLSPLPIPRSPTRSPRRRKSRSSASAAVSGSETVPMFPRYWYVEKSRSNPIPRLDTTASRWGAPPWGE